MNRALPLLAALAVVTTGCFGVGSTTEPSPDPVKPSSKTPSSSTSSSGTATPVKRDPNLRWHYHNYWGQSSSLVLLDANLTLAVVDADRFTLAPRTATAHFSLPYGKIIPPETGELVVTIHFTPTAGLPFTGLNFSYRPGGAVNFTGVAVESGTPISIPVSYDQTDVPHRSTTAWKFRLAPDSPAGPAIANGTAHVTVEAKIGRPLLIDPPHFDQWRGRTAIPLAAVVANVSAKKVADDRYVDVRPASTSASLRRDVLEIPLPNGSLVPERTKEVVVHLFWNATPGMAKPTLAYAEENSPSNATLTPSTDGESSREFRIPIGIGMADSPYANQSTWRFYVLLEGPSGSVHVGQLMIHATAERRG